jgi:DNA-binding transcriptional MerR regulator
MQIGVIAKKAGLSVRTIRYYEELGLVDPIGHSSGGFRLYGEDTLKRLEVIAFLKGLDLTLVEIRQIFDAGKTSGEGKEAVRKLINLFNGKLRLAETRLEDLLKIKKDLSRVLGVLQFCESCGHSAPFRSDDCDECIRLHCGQSVPEMLKIFFERDTGRTLCDLHSKK